MNRKSPRQGRRRRNSRHRGATLLFFLMIALPFLSFGAMLAVDFTKIIVLSRETSNATGAAALAGAQQYVTDRAVLNQPLAKDAAQSLIQEAVNDGAIKGTIISIDVTTTADSVRVRTTYEVQDLALLPVVVAIFNTQQDVTAARYTVTRTAIICIPDEARVGEAARLASCTRPR